MEGIRKIKVFKSYYKEFYLAQTTEVRAKIDYVIETPTNEIQKQNL